MKISHFRHTLCPVQLWTFKPSNHRSVCSTPVAYHNNKTCTAVSDERKLEQVKVKRVT